MAGWSGEVLLWYFGDTGRVGCLDYGAMLCAEVVPLPFFFPVSCAAGESAHAAADHGFEGVGTVCCAADHGRHLWVWPSGCSSLFHIRVRFLDLVV